ncbi:MAG: cysteine desulfurase [Salinisphaera sp.]|nr:cysteine desulfurase [Salinisphaera sp.]
MSRPDRRVADDAPAHDNGALRARFPALDQTVHGCRLVYLDNAATTHKPDVVLDALDRFYRHDNANVHRGVHALSQRATEAYEAARDEVCSFINAAMREECVFTRGTTEAINLVAQCFARPRLRPGDEILISEIEHHSNIVPWQLVCRATGGRLRAIPVNDRAELNLDAARQMLTERTRLLAISQVSNAFGSIHPVADLIRIAHEHGVPVLVDGAQAAAHMPVDMQQLDADFYAFSGHKVFGPTGIGVLYAKGKWLEEMPPWLGGGDMIDTVTLEKSTWNELPYKFEAGTPHIAGAIGLGAALRFVRDTGLDAIRRHEQALTTAASTALADVPGLQVIGTAADKAAIFSFTMDGAHPQDIATILDQVGVAVRTGHHCAMPGMARFGVDGTARASFACYNGEDDIAALVEGLTTVNRLFS